MADIFKLSTGSVATGLQTKYNDMLAGNPFFNPYTNSYTSLQTVTVGSGGASSITFSSIPSTYTHLQIRGIGRVNVSGTGSETPLLTFNSDSSTNYSVHNLYGTGSSVAASGNANTPWISAWDMPRAGELANAFGVFIFDLLDYSNTNKYKTVRSLSGLDTNGGTGYADLHSGNWRNTNAITQITITPTAGNFVQYSQFALYGVN